MALAGCSGSCSANRWHTLSVEVPVFLATKPKILRRVEGKNIRQGSALLHPRETEAPRLLTLLKGSHLSSTCEDVKGGCVIPWEDTLKWTTVEVGGGVALRDMLVAFCTAWTPVSDSISTEPRYHTLQAAGTHRAH
ncbi:hypothetical protein EYF80_056751 [Liparis tanakae]|uniref:Uncharacterized protein n=1 Tax=Liparis tanakae TaxID=230148 RepID=A0A4Z2EXL1_9TELE|nr:hypothetical protein EYF80_056751 [Liparis tanakae]